MQATPTKDISRCVRSGQIMPDTLLTALLREIEAHEDHKSEWDDQIAWLTHLQYLNRVYLRLRLPQRNGEKEGL